MWCHEQTCAKCEIFSNVWAPDGLPSRSSLRVDLGTDGQSKWFLAKKTTLSPHGRVYFEHRARINSGPMSSVASARANAATDSIAIAVRNTHFSVTKAIVNCWMSPCKTRAKDICRERSCNVLLGKRNGHAAWASCFARCLI